MLEPAATITFGYQFQSFSNGAVKFFSCSRLYLLQICFQRATTFVQSVKSRVNTAVAKLLLPHTRPLSARFDWHDALPNCPVLKHPRLLSTDAQNFHKTHQKPVYQLLRQLTSWSPLRLNQSSLSPKLIARSFSARLPEPVHPARRVQTIWLNCVSLPIHQ